MKISNMKLELATITWVSKPTSDTADTQLQISLLAPAKYSLAEGQAEIALVVAAITAAIVVRWRVRGDPFYKPLWASLAVAFLLT
tara:strand:- start:3 stop:257 length:255 start_codon:yes stop_codon:yes gene_type:complete